MRKSAGPHPVMMDFSLLLKIGYAQSHQGSIAYGRLNAVVTGGMSGSPALPRLGWKAEFLSATRLLFSVPAKQNVANAG
jgi:hypothetical protein